MKKLLSLFFVLPLALNAQVIPGYMGKRLTVGYGVDVLPSVSPTANNYDGGVNLTHRVSAEYSIRSRTNFCFSYRYSRTGLYPVGSIDQPPYILTYVPSKKGAPMLITSHGIELAFRFFHQGSLAPVGKYRKLGGLLLFDKVTYEKNRFQYSEGGQIKYMTMGSGEEPDVHFAITYEIGRQRVIADRFVLSRGIRVGLMPGPILGGVGEFLFDAYSYSPYRSLGTAILDNMRNRMFVHELFSVHVGLGFLAF